MQKGFRVQKDAPMKAQREGSAPCNRDNPSETTTADHADMRLEYKRVPRHVVGLPLHVSQTDSGLV